jgi:integrase
MTATGEKPRGANAVKVVRAVLADGTTKEYRYERGASIPRVAGNALRHIFGEYSSSPEFRRMEPTTRAKFLANMNALQDEFGWMTVANLEHRSARVRFYKHRDSLVDTPFKADFRMAVLRAALSWAEDRGLIEINRARAIKSLRGLMGLDRKHRDKCYTQEQEDQILQRPQHIRDLYTVALYTCLRRVDLAAIDSQKHFDRDGWLIITPRKTAKSSGVTLYLPVFAIPTLAETINRLRRENPKGKMLRSGTGIPWHIRALSVAWRAEMDELGFEGMRLHDIRHTGNTRLDIAGCTDSERGAINGDRMAEGSGQVYVARMREISLNAYEKWAAWLAKQGNVVKMPEARWQSRK